MDAFSGAIGVSDSDGKCTPVYAVCQPKRPLNAHYYAHLVREIARTQYILALTRGIRERSSDFRFETFAGLSLPVPPTEEQDTIDAFLRHALAKANRLIRTKRRLIELLQEQKQAIIHQAVTRGLDADARLKPSGVEWLGEIPEHWSLRRLKFLTAINSGQVDPKHEPYKDYVLIAPNHIESGTGRILAEETAHAQGADSGKYIVQAGQIIYSKIRPNLRKAAIARTDCLCSADMYPMTPRVSELRPEYLLLLLLSKPVTKYVVDCSMRVAMPKVNRETLGDCWLWYPTIEEQDRILASLPEEFRSLDTAIDRTKREIELIREYRTRLIADVVTGKLDVRGVALPEENEAAGDIDVAEDDAAPEESEAEGAIDADEEEL